MNSPRSDCFIDVQTKEGVNATCYTGENFAAGMHGGAIKLKENISRAVEQERAIVCMDYEQTIIQAICK